MPIEIRELIIKTTVHEQKEASSSSLSNEEVKQLKKSIVESCKSYIDGRIRDERKR